MNTQAISSQPLDHNYGTDVDELIRIKEGAKLTIVKSRLALLDTGVKILSNGSDLICLPNLDIDAYKRCNFQEFYWEVEYEDGSILKQFDSGKERHYGNIEQDKLKTVRWVSNFTEDTDNQDKRVIFTLDWQSGTFSLLNGFVPQEIRQEFGAFKEWQDGKKLILKTIKRNSTAVNLQTQAQGQVYLYNRYLLGYENETVKHFFCLEPNGFVHQWYGK